MNEDFAYIFSDPCRKPENKPDDPFESEEYQKFVESIVPHCHCAERLRPCDGVLAGGLCDNQQEPAPEDDGWVDWDDEQQ